jgi:hypothetical protein
MFHQFHGHVRTDETRSASQEYIHELSFPGFAPGEKKLIYKRNPGAAVYAKAQLPERG